MEFTVRFDEFKNYISELINSGEGFLELKIKNEEELSSVKQNFEGWRNKGIEYLKLSLDDRFKELKHEFKYLGSNKFIIPGARKDFDFLRDEFFRDVRENINSLNKYITWVSVSDPFVEGSSYNSRGRDNFTIEEKKLFLLLKLKQVNDGGSIPVDWIYKVNDIKLSNGYEARELALRMTNLGLIDMYQGIMARITIDGLMFLEEIEHKKQKVEQIDKPQSIIQIHSMNNSIIQQNSHGSSQNVSLKVNDNNLDELKNFIFDLKKSIDSFNLIFDVKNELLSEIETIDAQSKSPKPKVGIITETLKSIRKILESVVINSLNNIPNFIEKVTSLISSFS